MQRLVFAAIALGACGQATDDRPASLEYITEAIMIPNCANAQCHSAFKRAGVPNTPGYAFDTVDNVKTECKNGLVAIGDPDTSFLVIVLTRPGGDKMARMPYDEPLPDADIELIKTWIRQGADGLQ